jgi:DNA-binding transcriptional ArsR family regulator
VAVNSVVHAMPDADEVLRAIANPVRRRLLHLAWDAERRSADLADEIGLSRSATSQHLRVLRDAKLVTVRPDGTQRLYRVRFDTLEGLRRFLDDLWTPRLDRLKVAAEAEVGTDRSATTDETSGATT